jgi:hypothetical protein
MTNTNAVANSLAFLNSTLTGDATFMGYLTGGVWTGVAPVGTSPDWCVLQMQASPKVKTATGVTIMTRGLYQVKVVGPKADYANLYTAYDRIVTLLGLVRSTGGILACYQTDDIYLENTVSGKPWIQLGGLFRVEI